MTDAGSRGSTPCSSLQRLCSPFRFFAFVAVRLRREHVPTPLRKLSERPRHASVSQSVESSGSAAAQPVQPLMDPDPMADSSILFDEDRTALPEERNASLGAEPDSMSQEQVRPLVLSRTGWSEWDATHSRRPSSAAQVVQVVLCSPYREGKHFWDSILIGHLLAALVAHTFVHDTTVRAVLLALLMSLSLVLHVRFYPFADAASNHYQSLLLLSLVCSSLASIPIATTDTVGATDGQVDKLPSSLWFQVLLVVWPAVYLLVFTVRSTVVWVNKSKAQGMLSRFTSILSSRRPTTDSRSRPSAANKAPMDTPYTLMDAGD